jgi:multiple sugar transport system permease protein
VYRLMIFLPTMITISVAGLVWRWLYASEFGLFNVALGHFGIKVPWITDTTWAMRSIVLMTLWWTVGGPLIILLAGLRQIPDVYYEAAALDGATGWRRTLYITLPILRPVLLFVVVLNVIGAFQIFGQPFVITSGGPERSTLVLLMYIYEMSFLNYRLGYGAAMSWLLFVLIAVFSIVQFRLMREK